MRGLPNNPFREACFHDLWVECQNVAGRLEERTFTSREEKEAFAERVKFLVPTLAMRFSTSDTILFSSKRAEAGRLFRSTRSSLAA